MITFGSQKPTASGVPNWRQSPFGSRENRGKVFPAVGRKVQGVEAHGQVGMEG